MDCSRRLWMTLPFWETSPDLMPPASTHLWARLAGVSGGVKLQMECIIVVKIYPALSLAIGGRDGMDCRRLVWMTCSIYRTRHQSWRSGVRPRCWGRWAYIFATSYVYLGSYSISMSIMAFSVNQKRQEWVDACSQLLDDTTPLSFLGRILFQHIQK